MTDTDDKQELFDWREIRLCKEQISQTLANAAISAFKKRGVHFSDVRFEEKLRDLIEEHLR